MKSDGVDRPEARLDPDRKAAEHILFIGGKVQLNDQDGFLQYLVDLPEGRFRLSGAFLDGNKRVTKAALEMIARCKSLKNIWLSWTDVQDSWLEPIGECSSLVGLWLYQTNIRDGGTAHLKGLKNLKTLHLGRTAVTDAGLAVFRDFTTITALDLIEAKNVGDRGVEQFKNCSSMTFLGLSGTKVTDEGVAHFLRCERLARIELRGTKVTAAMVEKFRTKFRDCKIDK